MKESKAGEFYSRLMDAESIHVEVGASSQMSARFFKSVIPALVVGLSLGLNAEANASDVADNAPEIQATINKQETAKLNTFAMILTNKQMVKQSYDLVAKGGRFAKTFACEAILNSLTTEEMQINLSMIERLELSEEMGAEKTAKATELLGALCNYGSDAYKELAQLQIREQWGEQGAKQEYDRVSSAYQQKAKSMNWIEAAPLSDSLANLNYQNESMMNNVDAFNQVVIDDSGQRIQGSLPTDGLTQEVRKTSVAGWASAAASIAEGIARISGNNEIANQARGASQAAGRGDNYYYRGKREVQRARNGGRNTVNSAKGIGRILNDIGRDVQRMNNNYRPPY